MITRDVSRLNYTLCSMDECPLGAAAVTGTPYPIDRNYTATALKFKAPTRNSIDTVSDRDFCIDFLSNTSTCMMHLSRLAEEIILWSSVGFQFITLSDTFSTGSSIMPQKKNPDAAELIRGKTACVYSNLNALLTIMKGLPLSYNKDTQEEKILIFSTFDTISLCIDAMHGMLSEAKFNEDKMLNIAQMQYSTATDLADYLTYTYNIPFRKSHHITGSIVQYAEKKNLRLDELKLEEMQQFEKSITDDIFNILSVQNSVNSRKSFAGTSPKQIQIAIQNAKNYLASQN